MTPKQGKGECKYEVDFKPKIRKVGDSPRCYEKQYVLWEIIICVEEEVHM